MPTDHGKELFELMNEYTPFGSEWSSDPCEFRVKVVKPILMQVCWQSEAVSNAVFAKLPQKNRNASETQSYYPWCCRYRQIQGIFHGSRLASPS
jgi:hypothetical protein